MGAARRVQPAARLTRINHVHEELHLALRRTEDTEDASLVLSREVLGPGLAATIPKTSDSLRLKRDSAVPHGRAPGRRPLSQIQISLSSLEVPRRDFGDLARLLFEALPPKR